LFPELTVAENLALGAYRKSTTDDVRDTVYRLFPVLGESSRARQRVGSLSGGEQQMVALARALLAAPALIAMDEPSFGLAPILVGEVFDLIKKIAEMGIAILLVEQNATKALEVAHHAYVLDQGSVVFEGTASDVSANVDLMSAYTA
jgi:branched-chain amino acid transport system ATP-binding protein